jgi:hypothetical protein
MRTVVEIVVVGTLSPPPLAARVPATVWSCWSMPTERPDVSTVALRPFLCFD